MPYFIQSLKFRQIFEKLPRISKFTESRGRQMKILIIDDRVSRLEQSLGREQLSRLENLSNVDVLHGFTYEGGTIADSAYAIVAIHRTFLMENGWLEEVVNEAVTASKCLVLFSGSISENMFFREGMILRMNASDFYSARTVSFFASLWNVPDDSARDTLLLRMLYGTGWKKIVDLRCRHQKWIRKNPEHQEPLAISSGTGGQASANSGCFRRILLLHNGNLPTALLAAGRYGNTDIVVSEAFRPVAEHTLENYDSFVDERLGEIFSCGGEYDAVALPYSFSEYNSMEYTGIRTALHIRLTPAWRHTNVPVVFLGPEDALEAGRGSVFGAFLLTENVYVSAAVSPEELIADMEMVMPDCSGSQEDGSDADEWYGRFLEMIQIEPPANYEAPHSISNEWAIMRWREMFRWSREEGPEIDDKVFRGMLYFKYIMATSGKRGRFRQKNRKSPYVPGIAGKTFVLIDDAADKGWTTLLSEIIVKESGGQLYCFDSFDCEEECNPDTGTLERPELLREIDRYLLRPEIRQADCYIVDLKLCQEDEECANDDLTGLEVIRKLKAINRCSQVVVFTASDRIWNLKEVFRVIGVAGYAVKEDPENNFSRAESYGMFCEFSNALSKAARLSHLRDFADAVDRYEPLLTEEEAGLLDDIIDLMLLDRPEFTMKPAILNFMVFLENYLKRKYRVRDDGYLYSRVTGRCLAEYEGRLCFRLEKDGEFSNVTDMKVLAEGQPLPSGWMKPRDSDIRDVIVPLFFHYDISESACRRVVTLKKLRNTRIAHGGGDLPMSQDELSEACVSVIFPMLEKDYKDLHKAGQDKI